MPDAEPLLSAVIPVGPGEEAWRRVLPALQAELAGRGEILLSATTPPPDDLTTVGGAVRWFVGPAGRAAQQNRGAREARGRFLWFLHADSELAEGTGVLLAAALRREPGALWYFDLRFRGDGPPATVLNEAGAWVRSRWLRLPFGDQGFALGRATFEALGGFPADIPFGEDHALVWAAHRGGIPVRSLGLPLYTSARRYRDEGWLRTTGRFFVRTLVQAVPEGARWLRAR